MGVEELCELGHEVRVGPTGDGGYEAWCWRCGQFFGRRRSKPWYRALWAWIRQPIPARRGQPRPSSSIIGLCGPKPNPDQRID